MQTQHDRIYEQDEARAAAILTRQADGLIAVDEVLAELADADCASAIATLVAARVNITATLVLRALEAHDDQAISVMCRAAGLRINGYSAVLRMRRRHGRGAGNAPTDAFSFFSSLTRASAERIVAQLGAANRAT